MRCLKAVVVGVALFFLFVGQTVAASEAPRAMTLVYSGNLDGELEPCGCSLEGNLGGILRHVSIIDAWRDENPELFLLSSGGLIVSYTPHDKTTGEFILKGYEQMGYDAIGVQWPDRAYGDAFINQFDLPWVSSNSNGVFSSERHITRNDVTLAVYSWLDPDGIKGMVDLSENRQALQQIQQGLQQAKAKKQTTVLLTALSLQRVRALLSLDNVDILLIKSSYEVYGEPSKVGKTLVLQPGSRGMRFARVEATLNDLGDIVSFKHEVKSLPPEIVDAPRMLAWYQAYTDRLKEEYLASVALKKKLAADGSPYSGAKACKTCHEQAYKSWRKSKHAKAYRALVKVNKAFDSACVTCHVVGFEKPGGFIDIELTKKLSNVQCESCHGAANEHVASAGKLTVENHGWAKEEMCGQCHVQKHSPSFSMDEYWEKIQH